jgi:hypothetical protein
VRGPRLRSGDRAATADGELLEVIGPEPTFSEGEDLRLLPLRGGRSCGAYQRDGARRSEQLLSRVAARVAVEAHPESQRALFHRPAAVGEGGIPSDLVVRSSCAWTIGWGIRSAWITQRQPRSHDSDSFHAAATFQLAWKERE